MNLRYLNYCRYHGHTVEQQQAIDAERYPGGRMCGFILHNSRMWRRFWEEMDKPAADWEYKTHPPHATEFDTWLTWESCAQGKTQLAHVDKLTAEQIALLGELNRLLQEHPYGPYGDHKPST
jgi:hypothetical protein